MTTVNDSSNLIAHVQASTIPWASVFAIAVFTGVFIISAVGFAGSEVLHNAAHDIRHGLSFPCH